MAFSLQLISRKKRYWLLGLGTVVTLLAIEFLTNFAIAILIGFLLSFGLLLSISGLITVVYEELPEFNNSKLPYRPLNAVFKVLRTLRPIVEHERIYRKIKSQLVICMIALTYCIIRLIILDYS